MMLRVFLLAGASVRHFSHTFLFLYCTCIIYEPFLLLVELESCLFLAPPPLPRPYPLSYFFFFPFSPAFFF